MWPAADALVRPRRSRYGQVIAGILAAFGLDFLAFAWWRLVREEIGG
jgi:hypothetical protein